MERDAPASTPVTDSGHPSRWLVLAVASLGMYVVSLDTTVNVALPAMTAALDAPIATLQWIIIAFVLTNTGLVLGLGRLADLVGRRRVWIGGLFVLAAAHVACGLAGSVWQLVPGRMLQAAGAAMVLACGAALVTAVFPARQRGRALGLMAMGTAAGSASGPLIGGVLVEAFGWQAVFLGRAPLALLAALISLVALPRVDGPPRRERFDLIGAVLLGWAMVSLLLGLNRGPAWGWDAGRTLSLFVLSLIGLLLFIRHERAFTPPIIDLTLFQNRGFAIANTCGFLSSLAMFGVWLLLPYFLVEARGEEPLRAGWYLACVPAASAVTAPAGGWLADRLGARLPSLLGLSLECAGLLLIARIDGGSPTLVIVLSLLVLGVGLGIFQAPNQSVLMGSMPASALGVGGGMLSMMRTLGVVTGVALLGAVYAAQSPAVAPGESAAFSVSAFRAAFLFAAAVAALALLINAAGRLPRRRAAMPSTG